MIFGIIIIAAGGYMLVTGNIPRHVIFARRGPIADGIWIRIAGTCLLLGYFLPVSALITVLLLGFGVISIIIGAVRSFGRYKNV